MGRKRKTRWRRLSIGGNSGNEEEEAERESEILGFSKMNPASRVRSGSTPAIVNSYPTTTNAYDQSSPSPLPVMNGTNHSSRGLGGHHSPGGSNKSSDTNGDNVTVNGHSSSSHHHHSNYARGGGSGEPHYPNGYASHNNHNYNNSGYGGKEGRRTTSTTTGGEDGNYGGGGGGNSNGYYPSSNYYHHRNSYNNQGGGSSSYRGSGGYEGSGGYRGRGGGDYHHSSRFGGRFRKPRPYSSNYYYNNGSTSSHGSNEDGAPNRPSYNQEEYTKITTPRQDVLFKKGYLSQRKPVTQSSSVDRTSGPTTPSTNGTPDTHSTNGINSDYSEGYENGETDCTGVLPYDETVYYGPPPETAVFTDPNTGQVYYGQSNGEYFDAYPVMMGGPMTPVYYHVPYPGMDWNGLPTPIYPLVPLGPPPLDDHQAVIQSGEVQKCDGSTNGDPAEVKGGKKGGDTPTPLLTNGTLKNSRGGGVSKKNGGGDGGMNGTLSDSSTSSREGSSSTFSSAASTPMSPLVNGGGGGHLGALTTSMSGMHLGDGGGLQHFQQPIHHPGIPHFVGPPPPPLANPHHPHHHHPQPILYHPHPASFVYAPPIYNGVVVPIAPAASTAESQSSPSPSSRKKRKLRRRKKDDGQLTDESSSEEEGASEEPKDQSTLPSSNSNPEELPTLDPLTPTSSESPTSSETSPSKSARKKDLLVGEKCPEVTLPDPQETGSGSLLERKVESSQIPLEGDEVIGPPEETSSTQKTVNSDGKEVEAPPADPPEGTLTKHNQQHSRKPQDLTLGVLINSSGEESAGSVVLPPLKSPAEPSSPDSFNTTQSVAGSEVPSVSISETDFMNRTTSVDEVEEDLPVEFLLESTPTPPDPPRLTYPQLKSRSVEEESQEERSGGGGPTSDVVPIPPKSASGAEFSAEDSPIRTPKDAEPSPSPETIFERQLELPVLPQVNVETQNYLSPAPLEEPTGIVSNEIRETVDAIQVESSPLFTGCPTTSATVPLSPASDDVEHSVEIQNPAIQEPKVIEPTAAVVQEPPPPCPSPVERPQSITLAVAEWLKVQGSDALTPVNQLRDAFQEEGDESGTDDESEEDPLTTEDLALQTDPTSGLPVKSASPSNCAIQ